MKDRVFRFFVGLTCCLPAAVAISQQKTVVKAVPTSARAESLSNLPHGGSGIVGGSSTLGGVGFSLGDRPSTLNLESVCHAAEEELIRRGLKLDDSSDRSLGSSRQRHQQLASLAPDSDTDSAVIGEKRSDVEQFAVDQIHANCFQDTRFPSAAQCQKCHEDHYREWSVSPHSYAQLSPVFNAMSSKLIKMTNGTLGDFCIRCHTPVGMAQGQPIVKSNLDRLPAEREGVTCVVCHRINQNWGKVSGRQALVGGGLEEPIYGSIGNEILEMVLQDPKKYGLLKSPEDKAEKRIPVHTEAKRFFAITTPAMCGSCHDVFAPNGFRLEDAFSEFKSSPAAREKNQNCQDCHMGQVPGVASGYAMAPAAKAGNVFTAPRKRTNHMMIGPDYSIIHPGIFPHNPLAVKEQNAAEDDISSGLATLREWLEFDHEAGWGTPEFENELNSSAEFPVAWTDQARRYRARDILGEQFKLLGEASRQRHQLLSTGYLLGEICFDGCDRRGLHFKIKVSNGTDGHGVPTGFDAERLVYLRTTVIDANGKLVFISGDLDPNGDVRDSHSFYVHNGKLPLDRQLFTLQTRFLTRNIRGGEREQVLNIPYSLDPLPYVRPATRPFTVLGRPIGARKHKKNIEVGGSRWADYTITPGQLTGNGPYRVNVQLIAAMVPVNLIHEISSVGFDYGMSARMVADAVVKGHSVVHSRQSVFKVDE